MERDRDIDHELLFKGWTVIHFWGNDILKRPQECVKVIEETIFDNLLGECSLDEEPIAEEGASLYE